MRDIRADLCERLASMEAQRAEIQVKAKELDERIAALMKMLDVEEQLFAKNEAVKFKERPQQLLSEFVYDRLAERPMNKQEIRVTAERAGYDVGGRSIHLTLVNLARFGRVHCRQDGRYERSVERRGDERSSSFISDIPRSH